MSEPVLTRLFHEAAQRCTELAARALTGASAAGEVVEQAQALGTKAVDEAERLHREYTEAIAAVAHASEQSGLAAEAAVQAVHSVSPDALKAATAVKDMLVAVEGEVFHLAEERSRGFHALDDSARQAETGFHDLAAQVDAFEEHLNARLKESTEQLKRLEDVVEVAKGELEKAHQNLHEELYGLSKMAATLTEATAHALGQMLAAVSYGVVGYANTAISGHNLVVAAVREGYLDESKSEPEPAATHLGAAFETVREALGRFEVVPEPAHSALQSATTALLEEGEKAMAGLGGAAQSLQHSLDVVTS